MRLELQPDALLIHLKTASYDAEEEGMEGNEEEDWVGVPVWLNFHRTTLQGTIPLTPAEPGPGESGAVNSLRDLDGRVLEVDHDKLTGSWDFDDLALDHSYILGHDAVAGHTMRFSVRGDELHVNWTGRVALAYIGDYEFKYAFLVQGSVSLEST